VKGLSGINKRDYGDRNGYNQSNRENGKL